jgi:hypothetical protein
VESALAGEDFVAPFVRRRNHDRFKCPPWRCRLQALQRPSRSSHAPPLPMTSCASGIFDLLICATLNPLCNRESVLCRPAILSCGAVHLSYAEAKDAGVRPAVASEAFEPRQCMFVPFP